MTSKYSCFSFCFQLWYGSFSNEEPTLAGPQGSPHQLFTTSLMLHCACASMYSNHLFLNSNRTELSNVELESNRTSRVKLWTEQNFFKKLNLLNKNPFLGVKKLNQNYCQQKYCLKKYFCDKNSIFFFFGNVFAQTKFANFFSNFELLWTSNLRYKNAKFQTRTKIECISMRE